MTKKEKREKLNKLIKQSAPDWLTEDEYRKYLKNYSSLKQSFDTEQIIKNIGLIFDVDVKNLKPHQSYGSYQFSSSPKSLIDKYINGELFSQPETGQDPKVYTAPNHRSACEHAGRHWGWTIKYNNDKKRIKSDSQWISSGTFNMTRYNNGKVVLEPCDVEHRLWGLIGFPLGLIQVDAKQNLWYYNEQLPEEWDEKNKESVRGFKVNGMYLEDIIKEAESKGVSITKDEVLNDYWYSNKFNFTILPFYSPEETKNYFKEVNVHSSKSELQMFHAETSNFMNKVLRISSPKYVEFKAMESNYHPLYELMSEKERVKLQSLAVSTMVGCFVDSNKKPVNLSDFKLIEQYNDRNAFDNKSDDINFFYEIETQLDFLYDMISSLRTTKESEPFPKRQYLLQLLLMNRDIEDSQFTINDPVTFISCFNEFYRNRAVDNEGSLTKFGLNTRNSDKGKMKLVYNEIKKEFLKGLYKDEYLKTIGVVPNPTGLNRTFSREVILDSLEDNNHNDIDGNKLLSTPVGGHIISDMELSRMTDEERNKAFQEESLGDVFDFDTNCRAMSQHHNLRMGVLRLSEYMKVIHKDDNVVRETRNKKYQELNSKQIL
tara:strand:- start:249 stop:2051 length:1803 start_codon:yes stop_codon:yes gene_type:complete